MSVSYRIDSEHRVVFTNGSGAVTGEDLLHHNNSLSSDPDFDPGFNQLMNFTEATGSDISSQMIDRIANKRIFNLSSLRAIVVKPGLQYGLARMFQNIRSLDDRNIRVFLDITEAKRWLGLE